MYHTQNHNYTIIYTFYYKYRVDQAIRFSVANFVMKNVFFLIPKYLEPDMETV